MVLNGEEGLIGVIGLCRWDAIGVCWNLNTWDVFWMNQVQMRQSAVGRWRVGGGSQVLLGLVNARGL